MVIRLLLKADINIQSVSDIITNSSSEVFCRIESENHLQKIFELLKGVITGSDFEYEPVCSIEYKKDYADDGYDYDYYKDFPEEFICINVPYGWSGYEFYELALPMVLDNLVGNGNYDIIYGDY